MNSASRSRWVMRGLLLFLLAFANLRDIWSPDVLPNALLPFTLLREGNVNYDEFVFRPGERNTPGAPTASPGVHVIGGDRLDSQAYFFRACGESTATEPPVAPRSRGGPPAPGPNDHVCSVFPPGMGFLAIPFFLPFVISGAPPLDLAMLVRVGHVAAAFYEVLATLLLWAVLRRILTERAALALVLLYFLGTSVRTVASQALWQHAGVHLAVALALWLVLIERPVALRREFLAGLATGLGAVVRQTTALLAPFIPGAHFGVTVAGGRRANGVIATLAGAAVGALPLVVFNAIVLGDPFEQGYGAKPFDVGGLGTGLIGLLVSPSRGLFVYEPWAILAIASMIIAAFANTTRGNVSRRISGLLVPWALFVLLYATYAEWWGGRVFGPRFLDDLAPVLIVGLAWGVKGGWFAYGVSRLVLWLLVGWSLLIFNAAAFVYDQSWDTVPVNVNDDPSRLFSWADPQWLAVLRQFAAGGPPVIVAIALTALALLFLARVEGLLGRRLSSPR
jgi:hypothetical protein